MTDSPPPSPLPTLVRTVPNGSAPIEVWFEHERGCEAVMLDISEWTQELCIPVDIAEQVARAILDAVQFRQLLSVPAPLVPWCDPDKCADVA